MYPALDRIFICLLIACLVTPSSCATLPCDTQVIPALLANELTIASMVLFLSVIVLSVSDLVGITANGVFLGGVCFFLILFGFAGSTNLLMPIPIHG